MERGNMSILAIFSIPKAIIYLYWAQLEDTSSHQLQAALHRAHRSGAKSSLCFNHSSTPKTWLHICARESSYSSAFVLFTQMTQPCHAVFKTAWGHRTRKSWAGATREQSLWGWRWPREQFRPNLSPLQQCLSKILLPIQFRKRRGNSQSWARRRLREVCLQAMNAYGIYTKH